MEFKSRRSVLVAKNGCVACTNPLAAQAGLDILKAGGNAADAAVAVAAALNVTEPMSTGIGGDAFCLFYDSLTKTVKGINGSGRSSEKASLRRLEAEGYNKNHHFSPFHGHSVTVPGAASVWVDTITRFGSQKLSLLENLKPAIEMAETGFPVQEIASKFWASGASSLKRPENIYGKDLLLNSEAPQHGDLMKNPHLANTFKELGTQGKKGFYEGRIAKAVSESIHQHGGLITIEDMSAHEATEEMPISTEYKGCKVWEMPPSGQGIVALIALNILEGLDLKSMGHNSSVYLHHVIESLRLAFADGLHFCADPSQVDIPIEKLLSKEYAEKRRNLIESNKRIPVSLLETDGLDLPAGNDTVYFTTADKYGNACSFINSNYMGFGTGIVPEGCGFTLQNRGFGFSLDPSHRNVLAPRKRPYHTIIPSMVTSAETNELLMSYGVMGGYMQPQGHVQVLLNMLEFGCNPQTALDLPRINLGSLNESAHNPKCLFQAVDIEEGIPLDVMLDLEKLQHNPSLISGLKRCYFGRGQIISRGSHWWDSKTINSSKPMYWAGSDPRADGLVAAY
ncbi:gamma-glutamyltransferase YwrD isoform X1 [Biomphalaria pfeifferi]|uniref:Gamma-glutamyltransferase YwrD isoform X1 n=1 Tax=Biomphalaria pfeifferi TaxID=112525 RepID=A0AAD8FB20_BIOPF|nr:gamma-glutamyltransferase YwrD isoform X1 [Biomphalaria pfeifferi]